MNVALRHAASRAMLVALRSREGTMGFHHVAVATRNVATTHAFYTEAMGFDLVKVEAAATNGAAGPAPLLRHARPGAHRVLGHPRRRERPRRVRAVALRRAGAPDLDQPPRFRRWRPRRDRVAQAPLARRRSRRRRDRSRLVHVDLRHRPQRDAGGVLRDHGSLHRRRPRGRAADVDRGEATAQGPPAPTFHQAKQTVATK